MAEEIEIDDVVDDLVHASMFAIDSTDPKDTEFVAPVVKGDRMKYEEGEEDDEDDDDDVDDDNNKSNSMSNMVSSGDDDEASDDNSSDYDVSKLPSQKGSSSKRAVDTGGGDMDEDEGKSFSVIRSKNEVPLSKLPLPALKFSKVLQSDIGDFVGCILNTYYGHAWDEPDSLSSIIDGKNSGSSANISQSDLSEPISKGHSSSSSSSSPFVILSIVVQGCDGSLPVDEGSIFCLPDGRVLGTIEEVFGPVRRACYLLRVKANKFAQIDSKKSNIGEIGALSLLAQDYNEEDEKNEENVNDKEKLNGIEKGESEQPIPLIDVTDLIAGARIHCVSSHSKRLFPDRVQAAFPKGSDASNFFDEEVEAHEMEHSDDEEEAKAKANIAAGGRGGRGGRSGRAGGGGGRGGGGGV